VSPALYTLTTPKPSERAGGASESHPAKGSTRRNLTLSSREEKDEKERGWFIKEIA
jgi:hypothetical protein